MTTMIHSDQPLSLIRTQYEKAWQHLLPLLTGGEPGPAVTLGQWATQRGLDLPLLLFELNGLEGLASQFLPTLPLAERIRLTKPREPQSAALAQLEQRWHAIAVEKRLVLETGPSLAQGVDPLPAIHQALHRLAPEGGLLLHIPFLPLPLFVVLDRLGFAHVAAYREPQWLVCITRVTSPAPRQTVTSTLDVRFLPPPEPLARILAATASLPPGATLVVTHDRVPHLLYPRLTERRLLCQTEEQADGTVILRITHPVQGTQAP